MSIISHCLIYQFLHKVRMLVINIFQPKHPRIRLFFSILTGFSDKEKKGEKHQKSIVKQICLTLSQYRYQGDLTLKKRIKKVLHDLKMRYS